MALTNKQEAFCLAYLTEPDASKAYRKVYSAENMKPETINRNAHELLQNNKIAARVAELRQAAATEAVMEEAAILREVGRLALSDPSGMFDADTGDLLPLHQMPAHVRACIASVEIDNRTERDPDEPTKVRSYTVKKLKMWDKNSALEKAMKHLGSFERDNKQRAGMFDNLPPEDKRKALDIMRQALARAAQPA